MGGVISNGRGEKPPRNRNGTPGVSGAGRAAHVAVKQRQTATMRGCMPTCCLLIRRVCLCDGCGENALSASVPRVRQHLGRISRRACLQVPIESKLIGPLRQLGEAAATLLEPHLSGQSVASFESLVDLWCTPKHLEAFFTDARIQSERELLLEAMAVLAFG